MTEPPPQSAFLYVRIIRLVYVVFTDYVREENTADSFFDLDGGDAIDKRRDENAAAAGDTMDVQISSRATHVSVGPDSTNVKVLRKGL